MRQKARVGINGYGVIGKRCADAVATQDDMILVGVSDIASDYRIKTAVKKGYNVYASIKEKAQEMEKAGIPVSGLLEDLLKEVDIVIDCTPAGIGAKNKALYEKVGVKAIFQGGEKHEVAGTSFVAQCNYEEALGKDFVRVVSCNTTGICRVIGSIHKLGLVKKARVVICRRAVDPWESHKGGVINTFVPETTIPSHQGLDAKTVIPDLNIVTMAGKGPFNLSHVHFAMIETTKPISKEELIETFRKVPRVAFVRASEGHFAPNTVIEMMRDIGRPRADLWEVPIWEDIMTSTGEEVYLVYQVHNEAIVIPENIDAVRAMLEMESDPMKSIEKTDRSLGIRKTFP